MDSVTASAASSTITPSTTFSSTRTTWGCNPTASETTLLTFGSTVIISEPILGFCAREYRCAELEIKDDITGIGVIVAFLVTAWAAFVFLLIAYWLGLLPDQLLRPLDRQLFGANSRRCHSQWKETLDDITLLFSDQQLLTGIAIMLAGYYEVFVRDLDALHWHTVTYLAWMSSTVHLITLSLLRDRLSANKAMRNLRLAAMLALLSLLIVALVPSASPFYVDTSSILPGTESEVYGVAMPTKCFYGGSYTANWRPFQGVAPYRTIENPVTPAAIVSYTTLIGTYVWKISQFFESSLNWWRTEVRYTPEARLELAARKALAKQHACFYFLIKIVYLMFCMVADVLDSFWMTNLALFFSLVWGTLQVILPRIWLTENMKPKLDEELSFGQILPLMLLLQPVAGIISHFPGSNNRATSISREPSAAYQTLLHFRPSAYSTLADALRHSQMLTAKEKANGHYDPIKQHLLQSRAYRGLLWSFSALSFLIAAFFLGFGIWMGLSQNSFELSRYFFALGTVMWLGWIPFSVVSYSVFSRKLR